MVEEGLPEPLGAMTNFHGCRHEKDLLAERNATVKEILPVVGKKGGCSISIVIETPTTNTSLNSDLALIKWHQGERGKALDIISRRENILEGLNSLTAQASTFFGHLPFQ